MRGMLAQLNVVISEVHLQMYFSQPLESMPFGTKVSLYSQVGGSGQHP
jgi:hypothetical protein